MIYFCFSMSQNRSSDTPSLIDLAFTNEQTIFLFSSPLGNSDHVCINFDLVCYTECKQISGVKYNAGAANLQLMNEILRNVDWESTLG